MIKLLNKNCSKKLYGLLVFFLAIGVSCFAQNDIILKTDGEEMVGTVTAINPEDIGFTYKEETIPYTVAQKDIVKITFSSGRIQFFNKPSSLPTKGNLEDHHNKVAVLPFDYIKDQDSGADLMTEKIQRETYSIFKGKSAELQYQDVLTTNNLLAKAGYGTDNKNGFTMGEICDILGVEYVIQGTVSVEKTNVTSFSSTNVQTKNKTTESTTKPKPKTNVIGDIWSAASKGSASANTFSSASQDYSTSINMNIYNDKGDNIFSQDHNSFWWGEDAYKTTLNFLAKKSPLYKR